MNFRKIFKKKGPIIIAEVGNNHGGNLNKAIKYIHQASEAGADGVKFQTFKTENYYNRKFTPKKRYDKLRKFEFSFEQIYKLSEYAKKKKIVFFSTPFDLESAEFLNKIQPLFKISSGDNNNDQLIDKIKKFKKPTIISSGLINIDGIKKLTSKFKEFTNQNKLAILHCISEYPADRKNLNLKSITYLKNKFPKIYIGYSDHSLGIENCKIALSLGAEIIETHFSLNKKNKSVRDHMLSANQRELTNLVNFSNEINFILGKAGKFSSQGEKKNEKLMRRSPYLKNNLDINQVIFKKDIIWLRPMMGDEIDINYVIGKTSKKKQIKGDLIKLKNFKK